VSVIEYHETVWSDVFPGNQHTVQCLEPAVLAVESALELSPAQRKRTVWRLDGGAGSDEHLRWLIQRGYHIVAKGMSTVGPRRFLERFLVGMFTMGSS
jgi:hypothetical protein